MKNEILTLRLTPAHLALVDRLAEDLAEPRSAAMRLAIREGLKALGIRKV